MGLFLNVPLASIQPSEHCIREHSLKRVLEARLLKSPLTPPFLQEHDNRFVVIDGHNRLVVNELFGDKQAFCYIARSPNDFLEQFEGISHENLALSNSLLARRFSLARGCADHIKKNYRIKSIHDLLEDYKTGGCNPFPAFYCEDFGYLSSIKETLNHFQLVPEA